LTLSLLLLSFTYLSFGQCDLNQVEIKVEISTDNWGGETSWTITDISGNEVLAGGEGGTYGNNAFYADSICVDADGCYFFDIYDTFGDGILAPNGYELFVDEVVVGSGANDIGSYANQTAYCPSACALTLDALTKLNEHINGVQVLSGTELLGIRNTFNLFPECLADSEDMILLAKSTVADFDDVYGALFTTPNTEDGFSKNPNVDPGLEVERAVLSLQQGILDEVFSPQVYQDYPQHLEGWFFNSCTSFPGFVAPPTDPTVSKSTLIRANFMDPGGMNPYLNINGDGTNHALRPTGLYLAPGSVATVTVPESLVGQDFYVRVGSHEWDLSNRPFFKRLDRITKKFPIDATTVQVFNPLGGAISILVPYEAAAGIVEVSVANGVEAPFYSIKSFYETSDFDAELEKPGPWAVFETDNVMFTVPTHSIIPGQNDLRQSLLDWDTALQGMNSIMAREIVTDKHNMYMIADVTIRFSAYSIGYPMSNDPLNYTNVPGPAYFMDGPGPNDEVNFHETGHAIAMSKFPGEVEAIVNFPYIMAMHHGLGVDLNEAVNYSFVPNTFDIDKTATHRMVSNTFGTNRNISNTVMDEVRYQHRGYGHYFEIVSMLGWCPLRNFWKQEHIDFENGIDYGINNQDVDSRIIRLCVGAQADLRPLFHVFGILPENPDFVASTLEEFDIEPSKIIYDRLQAYFDLIPEDNDAFVDYALFVYPNLYSDGPNADPNYGVGWHYLKSLSYDEIEAQQRTDILQSIIDQYYPNGSPVDTEPIDVCCTLDTLSFEVVGEELYIDGGVEPYSIAMDTINGIQTITVTDFDNCVATAEFMLSDVTEQDKRAIQVFPNPTSGELQIDLGSYSDVVALSVIDAQGRVVQTISESASGMVRCWLPEQKGIYLLRITYVDQPASFIRVIKM
ncbi:MAG: M60 family peptidase N-terminal accessory domain-containing protein, partial [Bacteroidota bacterium]